MPGGNNFDQVTNKKQDSSIWSSVVPTLQKTLVQRLPKSGKKYQIIFMTLIAHVF